jgi:general secretion pathway protein E
MTQEKTKISDEKAEAKTQIADYLKNQGYTVTLEARVLGKSGVQHVFDLLALRDDGFTTRNIAICIAGSDDKDEETNTIFNFANKSYDAGIIERVLITIPELSTETKKLAKQQRIRVYSKRQLEELNTSTPNRVTSPKKPVSNFPAKKELLASLKELGYTATENTSVKGKSGVEHTFEILAYDNGTDDQGLGIDFFGGEVEIDLNRISLFDTKAYDSGIRDKAIAISAKMSPKAQQFAKAHRIKVIEMGIQKKVEALTDKAKTKKGSGHNNDSKVLGRELRQMPKPEALQLIPEVLARKYNAIPLSVSGNTLEMAMSDPTNILALEAFSAISKKKIKPLAAEASELVEAIDFNYKGYGEIEKYLSRMSIPEEASDDRLAIDAAIDAPLAQALNLIIDEASKSRASDIHIEPEEDRLRVRYRIDGTLQDMMSLSINTQRAIISRVKILADMNIADHHHAQDGQFTVNTSGKEIDIRVATAPTVHGEMSVLRLLDKSRGMLDLHQLGLLDENMDKFQNMLKVPYGMMLISGPTGAGKTTTLYASINSLDTKGRNIVTIEDPAEYRFNSINQIQVNTQAGITFASGLRSILRLDPDVILVGEIRDAETAGIAVQSALTGHLMLSSIHANDSVGVLFRLLDLGVEPFLIASSVIGVVAQRMVRRICPYCNHLVEVPVVEQLAYEKETGETRTQFLYGTGCNACAYTGYLGRIGIFEIVSISDNIRRMLVAGVGTADIRVQALKEGMITMMKDGMLKVKAGITTPSEVLRSAYSPEEQYLR